MLILMEPSESDAPVPERREEWRRDYVALAAVALAIVVSLAGVWLAVMQATAEEPPRTPYHQLAVE